MASTTERLRRLEIALGVPRGPLTAALFELADTISGQSPHAIGTVLCRSPIWRCDFYLDFPEPFQHITPTNVVLFGSTGVDCNQFGFVKPAKPGGTTDSLAVCLVRPKGGCTVLMPNLVAFLSLVAMAGTEAIDLDATDEDYRASREHALQDAGFREATTLLCKLPGVAIPSRPSQVIRECPKVELFFEKEPPAMVSLDSARRLLDQGKQDSAAEVLVLLVDRFLDLGDLVPRSNWQSLGELLDVARPPLSEARRTALRTHGVIL